jgi:hypothetical protein
MGHTTYMRKMRNAYKILARKHERKRPLGKDLGISGRIVLKSILKNMVYMDWIHLAQDGDQ